MDRDRPDAPPTTPTLRLRLRRSGCLASAWLGLHAVALLALWLAQLPFALRMGGSALLLAGALSGWRRHVLDAGRLTLTWGADDRWTLSRAGTADVAYADWEAPWVHPRIVLLRLRGGRWRRRTLALCADSLSAAHHRELRVRLRVQAARRRGA